ncbi:DEAD/DEAH box helicase [Janthinobacterium sp. SUN073]|uniref:DEAD/DEAH box helicase n=1 Tax=Janthinobacterium sp. SUN073 TaxID=3004102 RepID=UPI0025B027DD|nr:DEAD/DEAH box helicase [Janthinobacterium sp. SUN073]MDN2696240.1 DEAD/DEAH box helicase [Janthinobacterium sp. SUN073]
MTFDFTAADVAASFDAGTLHRGRDYVRRGKVLAVTADGDAIKGKVSGSGGQRYRQTVRIKPGPRGVRFDGDCSCPMDYNCKHVVALLLRYLELTPPQPAAVPGDGLTPVLLSWLRGLAQAVAPKPVIKRAGAATQAMYRLVYVLMPNPAGCLDLLLCRARLRVGGAIASVSVLANLYDIRHSPPAYMTAADRYSAHLFFLLRAGSEFSTAVAAVRGAIGAELLQDLLQKQRLFRAATRDELKVGLLTRMQAADARQTHLAWAIQDDESVMLRWESEDGAPLEHVLATEPALFVQAGEIGPLNLPEGLTGLALNDLKLLVASAPRVAGKERAVLARELLAQGLDRIVAPPPALRKIVRRDIAPRPFLLMASVDSDAAAAPPHDFVLLAFDYDGMRASADAAYQLQRHSANGNETIKRDMDAEKAAMSSLQAHGFVAPDASISALGSVAGILQLPNQAAWLDFAAHGVPALRQQGWLIEYGPGYRYDLASVDDWYAEVAEDGEGGNAWFELELGIVVNGQRVPLLPVLLQWIREAPDHFDPAALALHDDAEHLIASLPDGMRVALPWSRIKPILHTLGELYFKERIGAGMRLPVLDAARLAELEGSAQLRWTGGERLRQLGARLRGFDGVAPVAAPTGLQASLRPYQSEGLAWMQFLREYHFAGILGDDMGLGKTIQTLSHILLEKEAGRLTSPALVVAPTSLMGNWQAEAARFAPALRVLLLHGPQRAQHFEQMGHYDLVLTTYALLPRDEEALRRQHFHLLILDESQYIKNSNSKAAQTAALLPATHRLCLTGTPLQNHLGELWAQFHFLMPGLLGDQKTFNSEFRKPIEKLGDGARNAFLVRRIKPFLLRRTKDTVAKELPAKTEMVREVELAGVQRDLYETVRLAMAEKVRAAIAAKGLARSQIVILDALLKLRQVCCDPRLVAGAGKKCMAPSAKLAELMEMLEALLAEGRKVLVFSQFTSMLALIEEQLRERGIAYALLTGETKDRSAQVDTFQQGSVPLFLISLKAGGVGLNLTAADTVIHYDPWWNPAAENQATDRAWRIGQDKPVFVYKLIAKGTLEEKIQEMQRRKAELADAVLAQGPAQALAITQDDLQVIFSPLKSA